MVELGYKVKENKIKLKGEIKMKTREQLISYYEGQLAKVIKQYEGDCRKESYIEYAKEQLEEVKNGREW